MPLGMRLYPKTDSKKEEEDFENRWESSKGVRLRLIDIYTKELENLLTEDEDPSSFSKPNWKELQAFSLGQRRALRKVIKDLNSEV